MTTLVLLVLLAQPAMAPGDGSTVVFLAHSTGLSDERRSAITTSIADTLRAGGIPIVTPARSRDASSSRAMVRRTPAACRGNRACLVRLGQKLGARHLVLVDAGEVMGDLAIVLDTVETRTGKSIHHQSFVASSAEPDAWTSELVRFTDSLRSTLGLPPPPEVVVSYVGALRPPTLESPSPALDFSPFRQVEHRRKLVYATGGGALLSAGLAVFFGIRGGQDKSRLDEARYISPATGREASHLTFQEARRLEERANSQRTYSIVAAAMSATLGAATAWIWMQEEAPSKQ